MLAHDDGGDLVDVSDRHVLVRGRRSRRVEHLPVRQCVNPFHGAEDGAEGAGIALLTGLLGDLPDIPGPAAHSDEQITLQWKGGLPKPKLAGAQADYVNAVPGADVVVEATRTGFEQYVEVKQRPAAGGYSYTLPLKAKGLA